MKNITTSTFAYAATFFFAVGVIASIILKAPSGFEGAPPFSVVLISGLFILYHFAMLPIIASLPAPSWAKSSGFAWIMFDNVLEMAALFGVGAGILIPMRWGVHLATATWIIGASWEGRGAFRWVGVLTTLTLLTITFAGPFIADRAMVPQMLGPGAIVFMIWIVMAGRKMAKSERLAVVA